MVMNKRSKREIIRILEEMRRELEVDVELKDKVREERIQNIDLRLNRLRELHKTERKLLREYHAD